MNRFSLEVLPGSLLFGVEWNSLYVRVHLLLFRLTIVLDSEDVVWELMETPERMVDE